MWDGIVASVVSKCKVSTIVSTLKRWGRLSDKQLKSISKKKGSKRSIAEKVYELIENEVPGINDDIVGQLELSYIQLHSSKKTWLGYKLEGPDLQLNLDPRTLRSRFVQKLQRKWHDGKVFGNMSLFAGSIWLRVHFHSSRPRKGPDKRWKDYDPSKSVFIVGFHNAPFVLISRTAKNLSRITLEAIQIVLEAESVKDLNLSGQHVPSLADIMLHSGGKAVLPVYRDCDKEENPVCVGQKRKSFDPIFDGNEMAINEHAPVQHKRRKQVLAKFGSDPQPQLESVEYNFNTPLTGKHMPGFDQACCMSIELKGPSVLEGFAHLADAGLMKFPLPDHVTRVPHIKRNRLKIVQRTNT